MVFIELILHISRSDVNSFIDISIYHIQIYSLIFTLHCTYNTRDANCKRRKLKIDLYICVVLSINQTKTYSFHIRCSMHAFDMSQLHLNKRCTHIMGRESPRTHYNTNKRIPKYRHSGREPKPLVDACDRYCSRDHKFTRTFATNLPLSRELHIWDATVRTCLPTRCTWQRINSKVICHVKVETQIFSPYIYTFPMIPGITVLPKTLECIQIFIELYFVIVFCYNTVLTARKP